MTRTLILITAAASLAAALTFPPVRACAPVLVRRNGAIVNLDTGVEIRPGRSPVVLSPGELAGLVARHNAALAQRNDARRLKSLIHHHRRAPR